MNLKLNISSSVNATMFLLLVFINIHVLYADLSPGYYDRKCPQAQTIVKSVLKDALGRELRLAASILRLHFHDCFVQGCDGSILLDDTPTLKGEKTAGPNNNSARGFEVIDNIKSELEKCCPGVVSCADILAIAARDAVVLSGGPSWQMNLGRRDSTTASLKLANTNLPGPNFTLSGLISAFKAQRLTLVDLVALSGSHTIGKARCATFKHRLYSSGANGQSSDPTIDKDFLSELTDRCPRTGGDDHLSPLDAGSVRVFNNHYFQNIRARKGLLGSDQALYSNSQSPAMVVVNAFAENMELFSSQFAMSMVKMGNLNPLTGDKGEVRENCRKINSGSSASKSKSKPPKNQKQQP